MVRTRLVLFLLRTRTERSVLVIEIDMDDGSLWDNSDLSQPYRHATRQYVQECLGLRDDLSHCPVPPVNPTILAFESIGTATRDVYTYGAAPSPCEFCGSTWMS